MAPVPARWLMRGAVGGPLVDRCSLARGLQALDRARLTAPLWHCWPLRSRSSSLWVCCTAGDGLLLRHPSALGPAPASQAAQAKVARRRLTLSSMVACGKLVLVLPRCHHTPALTDLTP